MSEENKVPALSIDQRRYIATLVGELRGMKDKIDAERKWLTHQISWREFDTLYQVMSVNKDLHPDTESVMEYLLFGAKRIAHLKAYDDDEDRKFKEEYVAHVYTLVSQILADIVYQNQIKIPEALPLTAKDINVDRVISVSKKNDPNREELLGEKLAKNLFDNSAIHYNLESGIAYTTWNKTAHYYHIQSGYELTRSLALTQAEARLHMAYIADSIEIDTVITWALDDYTVVPEHLYHELRHYLANTDFAKGKS